MHDGAGAHVVEAGAARAVSAPYAALPASQRLRTAAAVESLSSPSRLPSPHELTQLDETQICGGEQIDPADEPVQAPLTQYIGFDIGIDAVAAARDEGRAQSRRNSPTSTPGPRGTPCRTRRSCPSRCRSSCRRRRAGAARVRRRRRARARRRRALLAGGHSCRSRRSCWRRCRARMERSTSLRACVRIGLAYHSRIHDCLLGGRLPELGRACENEDMDRRPVSLDPDDRQHDSRRRRRQPDLLSARVLRNPDWPADTCCR